MQDYICFIHRIVLLCISMKILITTEFYLPGITGVVTAVLNQRRALESLGHEVRILTIGNTKKSYYDKAAKVYYIKRCKWQPYPDCYSTFSFHDALLKEVIAFKPDIVHAQCEFFTLSLARYVVKHTKAPLLDTCHTDFSSYYVYFTKNVRVWNKIIPPILRSRMKGVDHIVCPTPKIFDMLKGYKVKNDICVIPVGLDLDKFQQPYAPGERAAIRGKWGIAENDFLFVSICRLGPEKNVKESIENFALLLKKFPLCKLLVVGSGTDEENLHKLVEEKKLSASIIFTGSIDPKEVWKYYRLGDIYISSSKSEIQGLTYIEALASGNPIICREDPSLNGTLEEGKNGYSFKTQEEFIKNATLLLENEKLIKEMSAYAPISVTKYGLRPFGIVLEDLYNKLLGKS